MVPYGGRVAASQVHSIWFKSQLTFLSVWSFSRYHALSTLDSSRFFSFHSIPKNFQVGKFIAPGILSLGMVSCNGLASHLGWEIFPSADGIDFRIKCFLKVNKLMVWGVRLVKYYFRILIGDYITLIQMTNEWHFLSRHWQRTKVTHYLKNVEHSHLPDYNPRSVKHSRVRHGPII